MEEKQLLAQPLVGQAESQWYAMSGPDIPLVQELSLLKEPLTPIPISWEQPDGYGGVLEQQPTPQISVVIPARNEAQNLVHILPHLSSLVSEVILVDGHSTDETIAVAQRLLPTIRVIKQEGRGKGDALNVGFAACTGDIVVMLDADGSADPNEIPRFIEALLAGNDFAKGSRFLQGGGSHDITLLRRLGNFGLSRLVNTLYQTRFSDLCYGYNAFWKHCLDHVAIDCDGFEVETLISIRMHKAKLKIAEVPSFEYPRIHGQSNLNTFRDGWRVLKTILRERSSEASPTKQIQSLRPTHNVALQPSTPEEIVLQSLTATTLNNIGCEKRRINDARNEV